MVPSTKNPANIGGDSILDSDLFEPERIVVDQDADEIEDPEDDDTEDDPKNGKDHLERAVGFDAFADTPDGPEPVKDEEAEDDFDPLGKSFHPFDIRIHNIPPISTQNIRGFSLKINAKLIGCFKKFFQAPLRVIADGFPSFVGLEMS